MLCSVEDRGRGDGVRGWRSGEAFGLATRCSKVLPYSMPVSVSVFICVLQVCGCNNILRIHTDSTWRSWHYLLFSIIDGGVFTRPRVFSSSRGQRPPPSWSRSYRVRIRHWSVGRVIFHFSVHTYNDSSFFQFSKWLLHHLCVVIILLVYNLTDSHSS